MTSKSEPYCCLVCLDAKSYSGKLRFPDDPVPKCDNHKEPVDMIPVAERKEWDRSRPLARG